MDWEEFLKFAEKLISSGVVQEEDFRSAGSRAYYALYNRAKEQVEAIDPRKIPPIDAGSSHKKLWQNIKELASDHPSLRPLANTGLVLLKVRKDCDYVKNPKTALKVVVPSNVKMARATWDDVF